MSRSRNPESEPDEGPETPPWLEELERQVRRAGSRLRELGEENARLAARVEELESAVGGGKATPTKDADAEAAGGDAERTRWRRERTEVRRRVEALVERLESLLD